LRVAIGSILQETNTFSPQVTRRDDFQIALGADLITTAKQEKTEVYGFLDALDEAGFEAVPLLGGWAVSYGRIVGQDFDGLVADLLTELRRVGEVDAVLLALHGAWAAEGVDSADGYVLTQVRQCVGPDVPIIVSLDMHTNLAQSMWTNANALLAYKTCPHIDTYETGLSAGRLTVAMLRNEVQPQMAIRKLPIVTQAEQMLSDRGVYKQLLDYAQEMQDRHGVLSTSMLLCQPWLDVEELGWAVIVITANDKSLAETLADDLAKYVWSQRHKFVVDVPTVDEALDQAMGIEGGPITLGEGADGTMGGSPGDSSYILQAIIRKKLDHLPTAAVVVDPVAVAQAIDAGVGQTVTLSIGGKLNPQYATPVNITAKVKLISDGEFRYRGKVYNGRLVKMGRAVVLVSNGINLLVTERTGPTTDTAMYKSHGIEPSDMKFVVVKSPLGLWMEYEPISKAVISVDSPGCCRADLTKLPFKRIPRPMFPFDEVEYP
jgi:microcystin degradation protein MlrC